MSKPCLNRHVVGRARTAHPLRTRRPPRIPRPLLLRTFQALPVRKARPPAIPVCGFALEIVTVREIDLFWLPLASGLVMETKEALDQLIAETLFEQLAKERSLAAAHSGWLFRSSMDLDGRPARSLPEVQRY